MQVRDMKNISSKWERITPGKCVGAGVGSAGAKRFGRYELVGAATESAAGATGGALICQLGAGNSLKQPGSSAR